MEVCLPQPRALSVAWLGFKVSLVSGLLKLFGQKKIARGLDLSWKFFYEVRATNAIPQPGSPCSHTAFLRSNPASLCRHTASPCSFPASLCSLLLSCPASLVGYHM